ncbi:MAG: GAF domain-containing protein, partial [Chloroflexota bacterium]
MLIDESEFSSTKIKPKLEHLGIKVDQTKSQQELKEALATYPNYDVVLVERDLPKTPKQAPEPVGFEIAKQMATRFPRACVAIFDTLESVQSGSELSTGKYFRLISKDQNLEEIVHQIQHAGREAARFQLELAKKQLFHINQIAQALITEQSEAKIFKIIVQGVANLGFDRVRLYIDPKDSGYLIGCCQVGLDAESEFVGRYWKHNEPIQTGEFAHAEIYRRIQNPSVIDYETRMGRKGLDEWVVVPLRINGKLIGKLAADNLFSSRRIMDDDLPALQGLASQAAVALANLRANAKESRKSRLMGVVQDIASQIRTLPDLMGVYQAISKTVVNLFDNVDHSGLVIFDHDYRYGKVVSEYPLLGVPNKQILPIKGIPFEQDLLDGAPFITCFDIENDSKMGKLGPILTGLGIKSVVIIPLVYNGRLLGSFSLDATQKKYNFSQEEIELAQIFASHIAAAITSSQRQHELKALNDIAIAMGKISNLEELLQEIVDRSVDLIGGKNGGIHMLDEERACFYMVADRKRSRGIEISLNLNEGMAGYLFQNNLRALATSNYDEEHYAASVFKGSLKFGSMLKVLLIHNQSPIGYLYVEDEIGREFGKLDLFKLEALASLAGSAIKQSQLLENERAVSKQLESLHYIGDLIEVSQEIDQVLDYSLMALTAEYALQFDRAA